jgi:drug/metabolite transporter (DMT)-like permease
MRAFALTLLAMLAFAGNSLLCRAALKSTEIDPASFTTIRIAAGALTLWLIVRVRSDPTAGHGNWLSAFALFAYAAAFSFAYVSLTAATGALILFGAVQVTMIGWGIRGGDRLGAWQLAGVAWGAYSLRGRGAGDPTRVTAGNFLRALPFAAALSLAMLPSIRLDGAGAGYAVASGALASGVGYVLWYAALKHLRASTAATIQLSVPAIAAGGGVLFLGEELDARLLTASVVILGGIALAILRAPRR